MRWDVVALGAAVWVPAVGLVAQVNAPAVNVRIDGDARLAPGEDASARFFAEAGSYVAVFQVGADGEVRLLVPQWGREQARAASTDESSVLFRAGRSYGTGAIVAVASRRPLDLGQVRGPDEEWRRVVAPLDEDGDAGVRRIARLMAGPYASYDFAYVPYYVGRRGELGGDELTYDESYGSYGIYVPYGWYGYGLGLGGVHRDGGRRRHDGSRWGSGRVQDGRGRVLKHCPDGTLVAEGSPCPTTYDRRLVIPKPTPVPQHPSEGRRPQGTIRRAPERRPR